MVKHSAEEVDDSESDLFPRSRHLGYTSEDEDHQRGGQMITSLTVTSSLTSTGVGEQTSSIDYTVSADNYNVRDVADDDDHEVEEEDDCSKKRILEMDEISISKEELSSSSTPSSLVSFSPSLGCRVSEFPPGTVFPSSRLIRDVVSRLSRGSDLVTNVAIGDGRRRREMTTSTDGLSDLVRCSGDAKVDVAASTDQEEKLGEDEKEKLVSNEAFISSGCSRVKGVFGNQQVVYAPSRVLEDEEFISSGCSLSSGRAVANDKQKGRNPLRRSSKNVEVSSTTKEDADSSQSGRSTSAAEDSQSLWKNQNLSNFVCMKKMKSMSISRPTTANLKLASTATSSLKGTTASQTSLKKKSMGDISKGFGCNNNSSDIIFLSCGIMNKDFTKINNSQESNEVEGLGTSDGVGTIACLSERKEALSKDTRLSSFSQSRRASNNLTGASSLVDVGVDDGFERSKRQLPGTSSPAAHPAATTQSTITVRQHKKTTSAATGKVSTKLSPRASSGDATVTPSAELVPTPAAFDNEDVLNKVYRRFVLVNYVGSQSDRGSSSSPRVITTSTSLDADHPSGSSIYNQGQCTTLTPSDMAHMYITEAERKITPPKKEVKRPLNMYMLYSQSVRAAVAAQFANEPCIKISARIAAMWRQLTEEQRAVWAARANEAREEHKRRFPGYRYNSQTRRLRKLEYQHARERKRAMFRVLPAPAHL